MDEEKQRDPVQYVLVRKDLPAELQAVHIGHACGESIRVAPISKRTVIRLLHVESEAELVLFHGKLTAKNINHAIVVENDGPYAAQAVSLATEPSSERVNALGKLFFHLKKLAFDFHGAERIRELEEILEGRLRPNGDFIPDVVVIRGKTFVAEKGTEIMKRRHIEGPIAANPDAADFACPGCGKENTQKRRELTEEERASTRRILSGTRDYPAGKWESYAWLCTACGHELQVTRPGDPKVDFPPPPSS